MSSASILGSASIETFEYIDGNSSNTDWQNKAVTAGKFIINDTVIDTMYDGTRTSGKTTLYYVTLHELGHVLGIGSLWTAGSLYYYSGESTSNVFYQGVNAVREYTRYFRDSHDITGELIPIEDNGGPGTHYVHPEEGLEGEISSDTRVINGVHYPGLDKELMTGWADASPDDLPLSRVTIGFLEDLGYEVNYLLADTYNGITAQEAEPKVFEISKRVTANGVVIQLKGSDDKLNNGGLPEYERRTI